MGTMRKFKRELRSVSGRALAFDMRNGFGAALAPHLERVIRGHIDDADLREMFLDRSEHARDRCFEDDGEDQEAVRRAEMLAAPTIVPGTKQGRFTALVSCHGIAMYDVEYQPYAFSTLRLSQVMGRLAADPTIETIFLDIDSPGGYVTGTQEAADAVYAARKKKAVVALVNPLAASAAYWIASQAETIIGVPSADVGSIGVFMTHFDCSAMMEQAGVKPTFVYAGEYKVEGNSYEPLGDEAKAFFQSQVDSTYSDFINAVARGRGVSAQTVMDKFGKGRCYDALTAKKLGMIDSISTIQGALASWGIPDLSQEANRRRADEEQPKKGADAAYDPKAPLEVNMDVLKEMVAEDRRAPAFLTSEGCEPITIRQARRPGVVTTYADGPWPAKTQISKELVEGTSPHGGVIACGNDIATIFVANGEASYSKIGETVDGDWVCELMEGSTFEPAPKSEDAAKPVPAADALSAAEAALAADAAPVNDNKAAADKYRRTLALLGA